ncbi:Glycosyl transferase, family 17 [uncultured Caudovirales phage]|uniref:Glycosyl transferase, family 17 n=1 Tax=uncultured Caudovirales phage TaxID=2100421 RepID=A0A6J5LN72_9CAUD|nr:Glycosyl transferase, family 17 [uncultured Caudovirales phage]
MTKIYDCFTFFNEFDLLELRLRELYDHVDHFVLVEANKTFQNHEKPLNFNENRKRFEKWLDKIIHVSVVDMPDDTDTWGRERYQRDSILNGITTAEDNDIIMIGDIDEIPKVATIEKLRSSYQSIWGFRMPLFNFKFNYMMCTQDYYSVWSGAIRKSALGSPEDFRRMRHVLNQCQYNYKDNNVQIIEHAGWHFTYLGNEEFAKSKIQSFAHDETNKPEILDQLNIEDSIARGVGIIRTNEDYRFTPVAVDDYFPNTIINNMDEFKERLISNNITYSAKDLLPK